MSFTPAPPFKLNHPLDFTPTTCGSARFMSEYEAIKLKLTEQGKGKNFCPHVGTIAKDNNDIAPSHLYARRASSWPKYQEAELPDGNGHLLTIAPTRTGKGTGQIITNLLTWIGSVLVIDIKGENYLRSAGYRATKMKQKVLRFAPFEKDSEIWNPIMSIRADPKCDESTPEEEEDARYLTNLLISPSGSSEASFWENSAKNFLEGLLLHVRTAPLESNNLNSDGSEDPFQVRERSMREVRRLLSLESEEFGELLTKMGNTKRTLISQAGNNLERLVSGGGKIGQSILAVALEQTAVWAYKRVHKVTYKTSEDEGVRIFV
jgi:type IV secretion system protein VirD4